MTKAQSSLVSIIIPAYNAEHYIEDAIRSALTQTVSNLEIVVVDDGSTDRTANTVSRISDERIRLITQENQGQSAAINHGVASSGGEYIKLLDADDYLNPQHLEDQLRVINGKPDRVASCRWGYFVKDPTRPLVQRESTNKSYSEPLEWLVDSLTKDEGMMGGWMWLIPRRLWNQSGGYDQRLSLNNDFHFSIQLLLASNGICFAENAIYGHRKGLASSLSASSGIHAMESAFLTTKLGAEKLLDNEDSVRIRAICADRYRYWQFKFYPEFPDLDARAESAISKLGGSKLLMDGGLLLRVLQPIIGWRRVRVLQHFATKIGWNFVLKIKSRRRTGSFH